MQDNKINNTILYDIYEDITKRSDGKLQLRPTTSLRTVTPTLQLRKFNSPSSDNVSQNNINVKSDTSSLNNMQQNINNDTSNIDSLFTCN